jgi:hypothetical protein
MNDPLDGPRAEGASKAVDFPPPRIGNGMRLRGRSADANRLNRSPPQPGLPEGFAGRLRVFRQGEAPAEVAQNAFAYEGMME